MKTMEGAFSSATLNSSRTSLGPSPRYFWISSEPTTRRKVAEVELATALASSVFPVPGSPYRMTPCLDWRGEEAGKSVLRLHRLAGARYASPVRGGRRTASEKERSAEGEYEER